MGVNNFYHFLVYCNYAFIYLSPVDVSHIRISPFAAHENP